MDGAGAGTDAYRIAVAVANPATVEQLLRTALDVAREREGEVLLVSVVVEPQSSPFSVFTDETIKREFSGDRRTLLDRAVAMAEGTGVPVDGRLVVAASVARGVRRAVVEFDCDAVLLGWRERSRSEVVLGRNVDRVVAGAPCDVLVEKIGATADGVEAVLLPAAEGANTDLAAEVARAVALGNDARVDVLRVVAPDATEEERAAAADLAGTVADRVEPAPAEAHVVPGEDVSSALVDATRTRDVTVLGATDRRWYRRLVVGPTPEVVGRDGEGTVVVTRRNSPTRARLASLRAAVRR